MSKKKTFNKERVEETFLEILKEIFGDNLFSVSLYGSAAGGNFVDGVSDINVLILIENSDPEQIEKLGIKAHKIIKKFKITPLLLSKTEFINSADVFPMEYFDIQDRHTLLHGEDETTKLSLSRTNLRHQLEDRLRGNVASLRQLLIASGGKERFLGRALKNWYGSLNALFKGLLRLRGISPVPSDSEEVIDKMKDMFQLNSDPFLELIRFRKGEKVKPKNLLYALISSLESLVALVDKLDLKE